MCQNDSATVCSPCGALLVQDFTPLWVVRWWLGDRRPGRRPAGSESEARGKKRFTVSTPVAVRPMATRPRRSFGFSFYANERGRYRAAADVGPRRRRAPIIRSPCARALHTRPSVRWLVRLQSGPLLAMANGAGCDTRGGGRGAALGGGVMCPFSGGCAPRAFVALKIPVT